MEMNETEKRQIAFALTSVLLDEDHEKPNLALEEVDQINEIFEKICDALDNEELIALSMVRPNTFVNAMEQVKKIDDIISSVYKTKN